MGIARLRPDRDRQNFFLGGTERLSASSSVSNTVIFYQPKISQDYHKLCDTNSALTDGRETDVSRCAGFLCVQFAYSRTSGILINIIFFMHFLARFVYVSLNCQTVSRNKMLNAAYIYSRMIEWGSHGTNAGSFIISLLNRTNSYVKKPRKSLLDSLQATFLPAFRLTDYSWLTYAACSTCSLTYSELRFTRHSPESRSSQLSGKLTHAAIDNAKNREKSERRHGPISSDPYKWYDLYGHRNVDIKLHSQCPRIKCAQFRLHPVSQASL